MASWVKGKLPTKSGNYAVRYKGVERRDDFSIVGNHWWNVCDKGNEPEVEWDADSWKGLGE